MESVNILIAESGRRWWQPRKRWPVRLLVGVEREPGGVIVVKDFTLLEGDTLEVK
jgi:hypothetical protein